MSIAVVFSPSSSSSSSSFKAILWLKTHAAPAALALAAAAAAVGRAVANGVKRNSSPRSPRLAYQVLEYSTTTTRSSVNDREGVDDGNDDVDDDLIHPDRLFNCAASAVFGSRGHREHEMFSGFTSLIRFHLRMPLLPALPPTTPKSTRVQRTAAAAAADRN